MNIVLITPRLTTAEAYDETRESLDLRWGRLLSELELLPVITSTEVVTRTYFDRFDVTGVILTGGNHLSRVVPSKLSSLRDAHECSVIECALDADVPIVGVCRGMQMIGDYFGATFERVHGHVGTRHEITSSGTGGLFEYIRRLRDVNSFHEWNFANVPDQFDILARASDGTIEAVAHKSRCIYGQMWHPERTEPFNQVELELIATALSKSWCKGLVEDSHG